MLHPFGSSGRGRTESASELPRRHGNIMRSTEALPLSDRISDFGEKDGNDRNLPGQRLGAPPYLAICLASRPSVNAPVISCVSMRRLL